MRIFDRKIIEEGGRDFVLAIVQIDVHDRVVDHLSDVGDLQSDQ